MSFFESSYLNKFSLTNSVDKNTVQLLNAGSFFE